MSKSATVFARVEPNIKEQSEAILNNLGLSMSNAIDMYLCQIVMNKGIPFAVRMNINAPVAMEALSKEELDKEIAKGMESVKKGKGYTADEVDRMLNEEFGI